MNRREFLVRVGGTLVAVPMVLEAISCGSNDSPAAPTPTDQFTKTNDSDGTGHSHTITVQCSTLTQNGFTYTSSSSGHTHQLTLNATQLQQIAAGASVGPVVSTSGGSPPHTHSWTLQKPTGVC